jgi:hypothetical protein
MGVIGEYPEQQMLGMLDSTVAQWKAADPATPIVPAIHLVSSSRRARPARRQVAPPRGRGDDREDVRWAKSRNGVLFLDIQAGHSTLREELPPLLKYLERPDVHLGVDPEFHMHHDKEGCGRARRSGRCGERHQLRHPDARPLVTEKRSRRRCSSCTASRADGPRRADIRPTKNVQVVMHMDGWGPPWLKFDSYHHYVVNEPVQFTGFKLFYHNDTKKGDALLTPGRSCSSSRSRSTSSTSELDYQ